MFKKIFVCAGLSLLCSSSFAMTQEECARAMAAAGQTKVAATQILHETHTLADLLNTDATKNLAVQHPGIIMNSAQRVESWIRTRPARLERSRNYGSEMIEVFPIFSDGVPEAKGRRIIGQREPILVFRNYVKAKAQGGKPRLPLFIGPPGTGKTELMMILGNVGNTLTTHSKDHFLYTFELTGLEKFPELAGKITKERLPDGTYYYRNFPCPLKQSPFVLLPEPYQQLVLKMAGHRAVAVSGANPTPVLEANPVIDTIKKVILARYMQDHHLQDLTAEQELAALMPHVVIKRRIVADGGSLAKIDPQGRDVDYEGLHGKTNPMVANFYGTNDPFAHFYDGKLSRGDGEMSLVDDFIRNDDALLDSLLEWEENGRLSRGGARDLFVDTTVVAATNTTSIADKKAKGQGIDASLDRFDQKLFPYLIQPYDVAELMVSHLGRHKVVMQKLGGAEGTEAPWVPADPKELFPPVTSVNGAFVGPDRRYNLAYVTGPTSPRVHIAPHTLLYMAAVISGTRLSNDVALAKSKDPNLSVINDNVFHNLEKRVMILMREQTVKAAVTEELKVISEHLSEGSFGMTSRNIEVWLTRALAAAENPVNGNCLTPGLALEILKELMRGSAPAIAHKDNKTRLMWELLADDLFTHYVVNKNVTQDFQTATAAGLGVVNKHYREMIEELNALNNDSTVLKYTHSSGELRDIKMPRLREVMAIYQENENEKLVIGEILSVHMGKNLQDMQGYHKGLYRAVSSYLSRRAMESTPEDEIFAASRGEESSPEVRVRANEIVHQMKHNLGYCDHCARAGLAEAHGRLNGKKQMGYEK